MTTAQRCIEQLTQSIIEGGIFDIPDGIQFEKKHSDKGDWYYTVRHDVLGELGRLHVLPKGNGALRFLVEVLNDSNELVEQQRQDILEPIVDKVLAVLKRAFDCEMDDFEKNHPTSASAGCEEIVCTHCGAIVALVICVAGVVGPDELAEGAEFFSKRIAKCNVPTWALGNITEFRMGSYVTTKFLALKLWPNRVKAKEMLSIRLKAKLGILMQEHCGTKKCPSGESGKIIKK
jgi:hypothetical protein